MMVKNKNSCAVISFILVFILALGQGSLLAGEEKTEKGGKGKLPSLEKAFSLETGIPKEKDGLEDKEEAASLEQELKSIEGEEAKTNVLKGWLKDKILVDEFKDRLSEQRMERKKDALWETTASMIERAYAEDLPLGISRNLTQFGYDIFPEPMLEEEEGVEKETAGKRQVKSLKFEQLKETLEKAGEEFDLEEVALTRPERQFATKFLMTKAVGPDYVLGPGDVLRLRIWGAFEGTSDLEIDNEGKIYLPKKGPVYVWGMKLSDTKELINNSIAEQYSNVYSEVTMGRVRTIEVFVLGDVKVPGVHILTPQNTVFHALYSAGGPTKLGSLRSIKLIRNGNKTEVDLYKFLLEGEKEHDARLQSDDVILVPSIGDVVGVAGSVKRPAIYEIKGATKVSRLVDISGGLMPMGYGKRIQVERIDRHMRKVVVDLKFETISELENSVTNIEIQNGDLVLVFPLVAEQENAVRIYGAAKMPGVYELKPGMKVKDLLESAEGLKRDAYLKRGEIARYRDGVTKEILAFDIGALMGGDEAQNIELKELDEVTVYSEKDVIPEYKVEIEGAVYRPGVYPLSKNMKVSDLLFLAKGPRPEASLQNTELFKIVMGQRPQVIKIDLAPIINQEKGAHDLLLQDGDHLFVRGTSEWTEKKTITLGGEVKYPGQYAVAKGEVLSSVIERAGGFNENAFLEGAVFTRKTVKEAEEKAKERFIKVQEKRLLEEEAAASGRVYYSEAEKEHMMRSIEYRRKLLEYLAETDFPGRILINLAPPGGFKGTRSDMLIEEGDSLFIPQFPSSVQIFGAVYNPSSISYQPGRGVGYYLEKVGGFTEFADKNNIYIIKANGETKGRFVKAEIIDRGDTIVIPEKFKYTISPGVLFRDTLTTVTQLLAGAAFVSAISD